MHLSHFVVITIINGNGNKTEWSSIQSVIIRRVIDKIGRPRSGSPINQNYDKS